MKKMAPRYCPTVDVCGTTVFRLIVFVIDTEFNVYRDPMIKMVEKNTCEFDMDIVFQDDDQFPNEFYWSM